MFETQKISYEVSVGAYQETGSDAYVNFNVNAAYHLNEKIDILAGAVVSYWGDFGDSNAFFNNYSLGGRYAFNNGLYARADYVLGKNSGSNSSSISLALGYDFGGGVSFSRRSYASFFPGN